jgi:IS1 family transposase|tara:strand:- start:6888 stop:7328 length:441 start_codon:yes stop_codon:yes gene_type:complete
MVELVYIPPDHIEKVWVQVENDITKALIRSGGYANSNHFKDNCLKKIFQLWILWDKEHKETNDKYFGVVITEIIQRPLQKCLNIRIMTGKHREKWQHLIKHIEDFARKEKCDRMELIARPGWERVLRNFKYNKSHVLLEKKLNKEK